MTDSTKPLYSLAGKRVWINGHGGMVGSALMRRLQSEDCKILKATSKELDLRRQADVEAWMEAEKPEAVFLTAATVGGIMANDTRPAEFIYNNLAIESNIIHGAWRSGIEKLLFLSAACVYPREAPQPTPEDCLLTGPLEPTNEMSAIAKIAGIKLCQAYRRQYGCDFISCQPLNMYGPGDNYHPEDSHVVGALLLKAHTAKSEGHPALTVWGSGKPIREFLYVDDTADALVFLMEHYSDDRPLNIGPGTVIGIRELAETVAKVVGFEGELVFDASKPDGMPSKTLDTARFAALGWKPTTSLEDGLATAYQWYLENVA